MLCIFLSLLVIVAAGERTFSYSRAIFRDWLNRLAMLFVKRQLAQKLHFKGRHKRLYRWERTRPPAWYVFFFPCLWENVFVLNFPQTT